MLKQGQVLSKDNLNAAFLSKTTTGTQVMLGSLNIQGSIIAPTFSGDTIFNGNVTMNGTLYFANGTTYYVNGSGNASLNDLASTGVITVTRNTNTPSLVLQGTSNGWASGIQLNNTTATTGRKFGIYSASSGSLQITDETSGGTRVTISNTGAVVLSQTLTVIGTSTLTGNVTASNDLTVTKNLEVRGEIKHGVQNEFPDPLMASGDVSSWTTTNGTAAFEVGQSPHVSTMGPATYGALKLTSSAALNTSTYEHWFDVTQDEWITFSSYMFCTTTSKVAQLAIVWHDATKTPLGSPVVFQINVVPTIWGRFSGTAQAPVNAKYFKVRVVNNLDSGTVIYFSGFQVERGRALTGFKVYTGANQSEVASGSIVIAGTKLSTTSFGQGVLNLWNEDGTQGRISSKGNYGIYLKYNVNEIGIGNSASTVKINGITNITGAVTIDNGTGETKIIGTGGQTSFNGTSGAMYLSHGSSSITFRTWNGTTHTVHSLVDSGGNWAFGAGTVTAGYKVDITGKLRITDTIMMNSKGIEKVNYLYFDYGTGQNSVGHAITSSNTDSLWINSLNNVTINLDSNNNNSSSMFSVRRHATDDSVAALFSVNDTDTVSTNPITVPAGSGVEAIRTDAYTNIQLKSYNNHTWLRNEAGFWSFQAGTDTERWDSLFSIYQANLTTTNLNDTFVEIGQRSTNGAAAGSYKGIRIVKYAGSTVVDGDFQAGVAAFSGDVTIGNNKALVFNDASRYLLSFTGFANWGMYWDTTNDQLQFHGGGTNRASIDLNDGNIFTTGLIDSDGTGLNTFAGSVQVAGQVSITSGDGKGYRFWDSDNYKIFMSAPGATGAGRIAGETTSDYNMYFRMLTGTNRGFVFQTTGNVNIAQIDSTGKVWTEGGVRVKNKYEIVYNATEDSLDFVYG